MASALNHPHILTVLEAGTQDGRPYLVTEFMTGGTLRDWARSRQDWPQVLGMLIGVGDGLAAAHAAGILHRDIKPENILLTKELFAKVADFGSAKLFDVSAANAEAQTAIRTRSGFIIGTTGYMSPEQALGLELGPSSDIFSFGVVLYELLTGRHPFAGKNSREVLEGIIHGTPAPLDEQLPLGVRLIVERTLEKDPAERYQSMQDLVADIRRALRRRGSTVTGSVMERSAPAEPAPPLWRQFVGDVVSITAVVLALVGVKAYLDGRAVGDHMKSLEYELLQAASMSGADSSARWEKSDPRLPVVIDISSLRPDKTLPTDRARLAELVETLRNMNAAAIGLDIDFSPDDGGNFITPQDPQLFAKWKQHGNVRVGVYRREGDLPRRWLGRGDFQELAAGLLQPAQEPSLAVQYSARANAPDLHPSDVLLAMPAALFEIVNPGSRAKLLDNPRLSREVVGDRIVFGHFPVDFSFIGRLEVIKYGDKNSLDQYARQISRRVVLVGDGDDTEDQRCAPTRKQPVSGVLLHASAFATLNRGILQRPDAGQNAIYNLAVALGALAIVGAVRVWRAKRLPAHAMDRHATETLAFTIAAILIVLAGVAVVGIGRVFWPDAVWLAVGLFVFPHVKHVFRIGLRWLRSLGGMSAPARSVSHAN
jgi:hypothetical protein